MNIYDKNVLRPLHVILVVYGRYTNTVHSLVFRWEVLDTFIVIDPMY